MSWMNDPKKMNETMDAVNRLVDIAEDETHFLSMLGVAIDTFGARHGSSIPEMIENLKEVSERVNAELGPIEVTEEKKRYLVVAEMGMNGSGQNNYCETLEDARACADIMQDYYPHVEICEGYPGHWMTVEVR